MRIERMCGLLLLVIHYGNGGIRKLVLKDLKDLMSLSCIFLKGKVSVRYWIEL